MLFRSEAQKLDFGIRQLASYAPDFEVQLPDGTIEFREVKPGYRQKFKGSNRQELYSASKTAS